MQFSIYLSIGNNNKFPHGFSNDNILINLGEPYRVVVDNLICIGLLIGSLL